VNNYISNKNKKKPCNIGRFAGRKVLKEIIIYQSRNPNRYGLGFIFYYIEYRLWKNYEYWNNIYQDI